MKLGKVRFERYKKFLKCFDKDAKELQAQKELLSKKDEQILNQQEQLSQKDEQITNQQSQLLDQQEKIVSLVKLLKSLGKTTLEIEEATGLSSDEIEKM